MRTKSSRRVKWHNFKMVVVEQKTLTDPALHLQTPHLVNLDTDPKEREPYDFPYVHTWVAGTRGQDSCGIRNILKREPLIPAGAPLDFVPKTKQPGEI